MWEGDCYVDRALPFRLKSAPKVFPAVTDMVAWALHCLAVRYQIHYLDDFLLLAVPDSGEAAGALSTTLRVLEYLGLLVAMHKAVGPACCLTFLGVVIDTGTFELQLSCEKVRRLQALLWWWAPKSHALAKSLSRCWGTFLMRQRWCRRVAPSSVHYSVCCMRPKLLTISSG